MAAAPQRDYARIGSLAWPILIGQLAVVANGVIDTAMTSRFSAQDLAALALGASIYISVFVGVSGVLQALAPVIAQLFGAQRHAAIGMEVKQGLWLALLLSAAGCTVMAFPAPFLTLAQASPELTAKATLYLRILALALPATLAFRVFGALSTAVGRPKLIMGLQVAGLALKLPLNALFIFGGLGLPALGGPGSAVATTLVAWLMLLVYWLVTRRSRFYRQFGLSATGLVWPRWAAQRELLKLGIPMGLSYLIEVTAYTFMALFIARMGDTAVAGHQIAANFGTVLYMLPLSIASATGTLVAQAIGAGDYRHARAVGHDGMRLAVALSALVGIAVWLAREAILGAYSPDPAIMAAALPLFLFISVYQVFDALQVTAAFILRAYKIAVIPTVIYAVALWGVGLGGGYVAGFDLLHLFPASLRGASGFWLGNSASIAIVAAGLFCYLRVVERNAAQQQ